MKLALQLVLVAACLAMALAEDQKPEEQAVVVPSDQDVAEQRYWGGYNRGYWGYPGYGYRRYGYGGYYRGRRSVEDQDGEEQRFGYYGGYRRYGYGYPGYGYNRFSYGYGYPGYGYGYGYYG